LTVVWSAAGGTDGATEVLVDGAQFVENNSEGKIWITSDQGRTTIALSPGETLRIPFSFDLVKRGTSAA